MSYPSALAVLLGLLLSCLALDRANAETRPDLAGYWVGALVRVEGSSQRIELDIKDRGGEITASYSVPELGLFEQPVDWIMYENEQLHLKCYYGSYHLNFDAVRREFAGNSEGWNPPISMNLKHGLAPLALWRQEEVRFDSAGASLAGTLFLPLTAGPHPALVLAHPSGMLTRSAWQERGICHVLAARGVAVLMFDKRGCGQSGGDFHTATFEDLAHDVEAAVGSLAARPDIDSSRIGLWGGSQGGWIVQLVASRNPAVRYVIMRCGPAVPVFEQELDRVEHELRQEGFAEADIALAVDYTRKLLDAARSGSGQAAVLSAAAEIDGKDWAEYVQVARSMQDFADWKDEDYDPAPALRSLRVPVLALFGEMDTAVPAAKNLTRMRELLQEAGNEDFTGIVFPGATHSLDLMRGLPQGEWNWPASYWIWERKAPGMYETVLDWMRARGFAPPLS